MPVFSDLKFETRPNYPGWMGAKLFFPNGYGVSVICSPHSYGGEDGLYELAVLDGDESGHSLCYDTPITSDVEGWLDENSVTDLMNRVFSLEYRK